MELGQLVSGMEPSSFECPTFVEAGLQYLGRGMTMNQDIDANDFFDMIDNCVNSLSGLQIL